MRSYFLIISISLFALGGCRLDSFFYENEVLSEYALNDYNDEYFVIPDSMLLEEGEYSHVTFISDNETIHAYYLGDTSKIDEDTVIVYCHGNAGSIDTYWNRVQLLANVGGKFNYGVFIIDYKGYGMSSGSPTEEGLYNDVDAGISWLQERGLTEDRFVMYGFSMGSAPACKLTAHQRTLSPCKLICEAPFASAEKMVQDATLLALPGHYLVNLKINNADLIREVEQDLLWMHGVDDAFLSIDNHGEVFYKNYHGQNGTAIRVDGAGHSTVPILMGYDKYIESIHRFIRN